MLEIGLSSCGFPLEEESFEKLSAVGIKYVEVSRPFAEHPSLDLDRIALLAKRYGVELWSYHLPFGGLSTLDIASADEDMRKRSVALWQERIKRVSAIGIDKFIAHPSSEPKGLTPEARRYELEQSMRSLAALAQTAAECGSVIAVEDLPRSCLGNCSEEMLQLLSADSRLRVCFDTNHLLKEDHLSFIEKLADRIVTLHVSDYDFTDEKHWLPGEGTIDWQSVYNALTEHGYNGVWLYELGLTDTRKISRVRELTFEDFVTNASEIFEGRALSVIPRSE